MAAVVRGGHPRQQGGRWGRARGGGRDRGGAPADAEPAQGRANPLGYDWLLWRAGNTNNMSTDRKSKDEDLTVRIFKELVDSPKVDRQELNTYGIPDGILGQRREVIQVIQSIVDKCNEMAGMRRRYLWRYLHGYQGKETSSILKKLQRYQEDVVDLHGDVKKLHGFCPPTPNILLTFPPKLK